MSIERIFDSFPVINVDENFLLRQITHDDIADYYEYMQDKDVLRYVPNECIPTTIVRAREEVEYLLDLFRYRRSVYWTLARKEDNKLIGSCGFNYWNRDHSRAEISYDLSKEYWGQGIMTKTVKAVLAFAFTQMQLRRVEATATPSNKGSLKVLSKVGFKREGLLRDQKFLHGKFHDAIISSILQKEFLKF